jgi:hypothetical protein
MTALKKFNIFTFLLLAASIGFAFRLVNVATFSSHDAKDIGIIMSAGAVEEKTAAPAEVTDDDTQPLPGDWINTAPGALRPGDVFYIDPDAADYSYPTLAPDGKPERGFYMATATIGTFEATRYATRSDAYQAAADLDSST